MSYLRYQTVSDEVSHYSTNARRPELGGREKPQAEIPGIALQEEFTGGVRPKLGAVGKTLGPTQPSPLSPNGLRNNMGRELRFLVPSLIRVLFARSIRVLIVFQEVTRN